MLLSPFGFLGPRGNDASLNDYVNEKFGREEKPGPVRVGRRRRSPGRCDPDQWGGRDGKVERSLGLVGLWVVWPVGSAVLRVDGL